MARIHEQRLWRRIAIGQPDDCWPWLGNINYSGHGAAFNGERIVGAHRWVWQLTNGSVPAGLCVLHRCDVPACCNPGHLFLGTHTDNMRDKCAKGRHKSKWAKLSREQAEEIILSRESVASLARKFQLSVNWVSKIRRGNAWRWLADELQNPLPDQ